MTAHGAFALFHVLLGLSVPRTCLARDYFKLGQVLWPSDAGQLGESPQPTRFACGSWCSVLGPDVCSVFEYTAGGMCKVAGMDRVALADLGGLKKNSWLKRGRVGGKFG